ncbi:hypothetical protein CHI12_10570 [Terribacillus saccharophilus]|uniref:Uncharacterized protein n=1 Tax=Terribacillus saccharophilus TaxID=361277 RepID=A0A268HCF6_9BACI|nr:hypothetical protein CHI12_10570 [Terribacillus saccharophilus]
MFVPIPIATLSNALAYLPTTTAAVAKASDEQLGYQIGSAIGLAVIVSIVASVTATSSGSEEMVLNHGYQEAFFCAMNAYMGAILALVLVRSLKDKS